jgi:hypothetical protein
LFSLHRQVLLFSAGACFGVPSSLCEQQQSPPPAFAAALNQQQHTGESSQSCTRTTAIVAIRFTIRSRQDAANDSQKLVRISPASVKVTRSAKTFHNVSTVPAADDSKSLLDRDGVSRHRRWLKAIALSAAVVFTLGAVQSAQAHDPWYRDGYGVYGGYSGFGYRSGYGGDPYHYYTGPYNHHDGPHDAPHFGPHFHWSHGYHDGFHWQDHYDDHGSAGHYGWRPWSWH